MFLDKLMISQVVSVYGLTAPPSSHSEMPSRRISVRIGTFAYCRISRGWHLGAPIAIVFELYAGIVECDLYLHPDDRTMDIWRSVSCHTCVRDGWLGEYHAQFGDVSSLIEASLDSLSMGCLIDSVCSFL